MLAVEVLVQAVVVAGAVLQQQRRRPRLAGLVAALEEVRVRRPESATSMPIASFQRLAIVGELRIERGAQRRDRVGQRIGEVLVFAAAEAVPRHDDAAAERLVLADSAPASAAHSSARQQRPGHGAALRVQAAMPWRPNRGLRRAHAMSSSAMLADGGFASLA